MKKVIKKKIQIPAAVQIIILLLIAAGMLLNMPASGYCTNPGKDISVTSYVRWDRQDKIIVNGIIKAITPNGICVKLKSITYSLTVKNNDDVLYADSVTEEDDSLLKSGKELTRLHVFPNLHIKGVTKNTVANGEVHVDYKLVEKTCLMP